MKYFFFLFVVVGWSFAAAQSTFKKSVITDPVESTQNKIVEKPETYAIVVGVSKYRNIRPQLSYAHKDAMDFRDYLISEAGGLVNPANITLLIDSAATWPKVDAEFGILQEKIDATKGCKVIIFLSMHGGTDDPNKRNAGHLFTYDTDYANLESSSMSIHYLQQKIQAFVEEKQAKVQVYIDACRSGLMMKSDQNENLVAVQLLAEWEKVVKIISCQPQESSYEGPQWQNGVFTYYLLRGLRGMADGEGEGTEKDGEVSAEELYNYLRKVKLDLTKDNPQSPQRQGDENSVLAKVHLPTLAALKANRNLLPTIQPLESKGLVDQVLAKTSIETQMNYENFKKYLADPKYSKEAIKVYDTLVANPELVRIKGILKFEIIASLLDQSNIFFYKVLSSKINQPKIEPKVLVRNITNLGFIADRIGKNHSLYKSVRASTATYLGLYFWEAEKDTVKALECLDRAIELDTLSFTAYSQKGSILSKIGKFQEAMVEIKKSLRFAPKSSYLHFIEGSILVENNKFEESIESFNNALKLKNDYGEALWAKGIALRVIGRYQEGLACIDTALTTTDYDRGTLLHSKGKILVLLQRFDEALAVYDSAFKIKIDDADSYFRQGVIFHKKDRNREALNSFENCLKYEPNDEHALLMAAILSGSFEKYNEAINHWISYLKIKPNEHYVFSSIGLCYIKIKNYDKTIEYLQKAIEIEPTNKDDNYNIACAYSCKNQTAQALSYLEKSMQNGYNDFAWIEKDTDLVNLRKLPAFQELISKYKK